VTTRTNFVLVDFENVQPKDIGLLKDGPFKVKVFLGPNQSKIPVSLAAALQSLGESAPAATQIPPVMATSKSPSS
jgi:hypothetical protein